MAAVSISCSSPFCPGCAHASHKYLVLGPNQRIDVHSWAERWPRKENQGERKRDRERKRKKKQKKKKRKRKRKRQEEEDEEEKKSIIPKRKKTNSETWETGPD